MKTALAKLFETTRDLLPKFYAVRLAQTSQLLDLLINEFSTGIAMVFLDPQRHTPYFLVARERQKSAPIPWPATASMARPSSHASSSTFQE